MRKQLIVGAAIGLAFLFALAAGLKAVGAVTAGSGPAYVGDCKALDDGNIHYCGAAPDMGASEHGLNYLRATTDAARTRVYLRWGQLAGPTVAVYRNGVRVQVTPNDDAAIAAIPRAPAGTRFAFKVCERIPVLPRCGSRTVTK